MKVKLLSRVQLFATPWTVAHQAPLSMGFSRQEYWSGLLFPSPGDLPKPGIEPGSPALQVDILTSEPPGKPQIAYSCMQNQPTNIYFGGPMVWKTISYCSLNVGIKVEGAVWGEWGFLEGFYYV